MKRRTESAAPKAKKCRRSKRSTSYRAEDDVKRTAVWWLRVTLDPPVEHGGVSTCTAGRASSRAARPRRSCSGPCCFWGRARAVCNFKHDCAGYDPKVNHLTHSALCMLAFDKQHGAPSDEPEPDRFAEGRDRGRLRLRGGT